MKKVMLDGNGAAAEAMRLARPSVIALYPITPQSSISEKLAEYVDFGQLDAKYIRVESEHSAMSAVTAAALTGVRAGTATASQGLALMTEVLSMTSGLRLPVVMPVVNRGLAAPWTLQCEHGDAMTVRDLGWMQFYCQNVQEIFDLMMIAYKTAEDGRVLTPAMVCLDGFFLSHSMQKLEIPSQEEIDNFIGRYIPKNMYLDTEDPMFCCDLTGPEEFAEMRYQQKVGMDQAKKVVREVMEEYGKRFGHCLGEIEEYCTGDAEAVLVALGSMCGTVKYVVNQLRAAGEKVGLLKITMFRPFPGELIRKALAHVPVVGVFDRSSCLGNQHGPLWSEVTAALTRTEVDVRHYIGGLGGRDVPAAIVEKMFRELLAIRRGESDSNTEWIDVREDAMNIRQVMKYVRD